MHVTNLNDYLAPSSHVTTRKYFTVDIHSTSTTNAEPSATDDKLMAICIFISIFVFFFIVFIMYVLYFYWTDPSDSSDTDSTRTLPSSQESPSPVPLKDRSDEPVDDEYAFKNIVSGIESTLSFGATRTRIFGLENHDDVCVDLAHGSLFIMKPPTNQYWYHKIPPQPEVTEARISLSFRRFKRQSLPKRPCMDEDLPENDWLDVALKSDASLFVAESPKRISVHEELGLSLQ